MKLSEQGLANRAQWEEKGYSLPKFDRAEMIAATKDGFILAQVIFFARFSVISHKSF